MSSASEYEEWFKTWPELCYGLYRIDRETNKAYLDSLHTLGINLFLAGALELAARGALQAGIDLGMELVAKTMQEDAMRAALKAKQDILVPSRQLILPGSEGWKP